MIKNLFKNEKQADIFKILLISVVYLIVFSIFKAGLDFQKLVPFKQLQKDEKKPSYKYNLDINGKAVKLDFNEKKNLAQILDSYFEKDIQFINYLNGTSIDSIYNSKDIFITISNNETSSKKIPTYALDSETVIKINY